MSESSNKVSCSPFASLAFPTDNSKAAAEFAAAYTLQKDEMLSDAITHYKSVIEQLPECFEAYYNMGLCQRDQGKITEAITSFENTARLHPLFKLVYKDLADLYTKVGQTSDAEGAIAAYSQL